MDFFNRLFYNEKYYTSANDTSANDTSIHTSPKKLTRSFETIPKKTKKKYTCKGKLYKKCNKKCKWVKKTATKRGYCRTKLNKTR